MRHAVSARPVCVPTRASRVKPATRTARQRQRALDNSRAVRHGGDPRGRGVSTFAEAAERTIELHRDGWKAGSPLPEQWESTFRLHAAPLLDMPVDRITSADVLGCLAPVWTSNPTAARKARNRIAAVFRWCIGRNHRPDNPVDRAIVALPRANGNAPNHYRALPHQEVAAALGAIHRMKYIHPSAVLCVEMIALTAVRAGEARGARWDEIDFEAARWSIPASRMKARASASRGRLDGSRVPFERAVVDGRVRRRCGGRGGLPCPRAAQPGRPSVLAVRLAGAPRRSAPGMEPLYHLAIDHSRLRIAESKTDTGVRARRSRPPLGGGTAASLWV